MSTTITDQINSGSLAFTAWHDPLADTGFPTHSDETLIYLTPILGPSGVIVLHRIAWYHASGIALWVVAGEALMHIRSPSTLTTCAKNGRWPPLVEPVETTAADALARPPLVEPVETTAGERPD